ncbi:Cytochrome P450 4c21, partial [Orchesella cincta]
MSAENCSSPVFQGFSRSLDFVTLQNGLLFIFAAVVVLYYASRRRKTRKRKLPGPGQHFLGAFANILALWDMKKCLKVFENWCGKYGPVFTLNFGPYSLTVLNSPEYIQKLLGSKDMDYFGKGFIYKPFKPYWQDGLLTSKGEKWKFRRKLLERHIFSFKTLTGYMSIFNEEGDKLVKQMEEIFSDGSERGIEELLMSASLEIITSATLGKTVAQLEAATNVDITFPYAINQAKEIIAKRSKEPWLLLDFIWRLHPLSNVEKVILSAAKKLMAATLIKNPVQNRQIGIGINEALLSAGVPVEESITLICALPPLPPLVPRPSSPHQELCRKEVDSIFEDEDLCPSGQL